MRAFMVFKPVKPTSACLLLFTFWGRRKFLRPLLAGVTSFCRYNMNDIGLFLCLLTIPLPLCDKDITKNTKREANYQNHLLLLNTDRSPFCTIGENTILPLPDRLNHNIDPAVRRWIG